MKYDVFISYSSKDQKVAEGICGFLESNGIRCFVAFRDIAPGTVWASEIVKGLEASAMMVIVYSQNFNHSEQVDREIELAAEDHKPMLTYRLSDDKFEGAKKYYLKNINWIDAFPNPEEVFGKLLENVKRLLPQDGQRETIAKKSPTPVAPATDKSEEQSLLTSVLKVTTDIDCRIFIDGEERGTAVRGSITRIPLRGGSYLLRFVAIDNPTMVVEENCFHIERDTEELYSVFNRKEDYSERQNYINNELIDMVIEADDDACSRPVDLVPDRNNGDWGNWGFVNKSGIGVIPFIYEDAKSFCDGLALVKKNSKWGFIDKSGRDIIPFVYDNAYSFCEGLAPVEKNGKWGFINKTGREVIPFVYDNADLFCNGLAPVKKNGRWGYIDKTGKEIIPFIYGPARSFSEGLAAVVRNKRWRDNDKWGFIDMAGKEVIPFVYDTAFSFSKGYASVKKDGKWGYIDKTGKWVKDKFYLL